MTVRERRAFLLMAGVLVLGGAVMTLVSVHPISPLQARGVALAAAVSYDVLIGPAQVGARIVEMDTKGRHNPFWTLTAAMVSFPETLPLLASFLSWQSLPNEAAATRSNGHTRPCRPPSRRPGCYG